MIHYTLSNNRLLPIEYLEVAYIESTGTLYIDTEYIPTSLTTFSLKALCTKNASFLMGTSNNSGPAHQFSLYINNNIARVMKGSSTGYTITINNITNELLNVNLSETSLTINGNSINFEANVTQVFSNLHLLKVNGGSNLYTNGKLYFFILWESGVLKRHFVPCYRKSDNKPGLFDIVEKKFYINQGTGEFLVGNEVRSLPSGYLLLEYIESNGNLYIDTGITANETTEIECKFYNMYYTTNINDSRSNEVFGACQDYCTNAFEFMSNYGFTTYGSGGVNSYGKFNVTEGIHTVIKRQEKTYLDGVLKFTSSNTGEFTTPANIRIFATKRTSQTTALSNPGIRIYYYKHKNNDSLVRDMVPCLQTASGKNGMFDLVNNVFYPSATGVNFISGNPIENIIEVEKTGILNILPYGLELYDYIQSSGTLWIDTGVIANLYPIEFKTNLCFTDDVTNEKDFFGNFNDGTSTNCFVCGKYSKLFYQWGGNAYRVGTVVLNQFYELSYRFNGASGRTLTIDGTVNTSTVTNNFISRTNTLGMFSGASNKVYCAASVKMKYSLILINDVLVRNFLPCTYYGTPGMWDTVECKFYSNQGTGTFTLGNKITLKEYLYLLGASGAYIITNYTPNINTRVRTKIIAGSNTTSNAIAGYTWTLYSAFLMVHYNTIKWHMNSGTGLTSTVDVRNNTVVEIEAKSNSLSVNGVSTTGNPLSSYSQANYYLFYTPYFSGTNANNEYFTGKMYYFQIYDNNQLVRYFIPASYNGTPGMWDKVEWKFYGNAGTGSFTVGPEVTQTQKNLQLNNIGYSYGIEGQYDKNIYTESDGSKWIRIFHHNDPTNNGVFDASDTFTTGVYKDGNRWFDVAKCNEVNKWELILKLKTTSDTSELKFRWIQYVNPMIGTFNDVAYDKIKRIEWVGDYNRGGLYKLNSTNTYLSQNNTATNNWYGALGAKVIWANGVPGFGSNCVVTTGYMDLYLRVDNTCPIYSGCYKFNKGSIIKGKCFLTGSNPTFTVSFWYKWFSNPLAWGDIIGFTGNFSLRFEKTSGTPHYWYNYPCGTASGINAGNFTSDTWYMVTFLCNGTLFKAYQNGVLLNTIVLSGTAWEPNGTIYMGDTYNMYYYLQDLRLYDRALTDDEIKKLYNMRNV